MRIFHAPLSLSLKGGERPARIADLIALHLR
jgi:hypothetical protein